MTLGCPASSCSTFRLSYADLDEESARVAARLGVLRSGGAYVPIDPHWPVRRLAAVITASGLRTVLTQPALKREREVSLPAAALFSAPTVRALADRVRQTRAAA